MSKISRLAILRIFRTVGSDFRKLCQPSRRIELMSDNLAEWVADKLAGDPNLYQIDQISEDRLRIGRKTADTFTVGLLGLRGLVTEEAIRFFITPSEPLQFVCNVPAQGIWSGAAIDLVHQMPAAFGGMGDLKRASREPDVATYRFKGFQFVEDGLRQHSAVRSVTRVFDRVFLAERYRGPAMTVVLVDAYEMSAEDIRLARTKYGPFDLALKTTSYGGIASPAHDAAQSMNAEAVMWGGLMGRLNKP